MNRLLQGLQNVEYTENGALTHGSSGSALLDAFYHIPARRGIDNTHMFDLAMKENPMGAMLFLFHLRDIRNGKGERDSFRNILVHLARNSPAVVVNVLPLVPYYGRWDDLWCLLDTELKDHVINLVRNQWMDDLNKYQSGEGISLLAKWLPSSNTSSKETRRRANVIAASLGLSITDYRKSLSLLREYLRVTERLMSQRRFTEINFEGVSSYAMKLYRKAFYKNTPEAFGAYMEQVKSGEKVIHSDVLFPYDIVRIYMNENHRGDINVDTVLEEQWKALPDYIGEGSFLTVCDVSGSMYPNAINVAVSVAIYGAERCKSVFKDTFLTFSAKPQFVQLKGKSLAKRIQNTLGASWGWNTNLQAAMSLILNTAIMNNVPQEDMPETLVIVSDMQFDATNSGATNLMEVGTKFTAAGYTMPKIVFWDVDSRVNEVPAMADKSGVFLASGASANTFKAVLSCTALTPLDMMWETLLNENYYPVRKALKDLM
jgi:hypothetical protein